MTGPAGPQAGPHGKDRKFSCFPGERKIVIRSILEGRTRAAYRFTDLSGQHCWTPAVVGRIGPRTPAPILWRFSRVMFGLTLADKFVK